MNVTAPKAPTSPASRFQTADEWLRSLGNVALNRIVFDPLPGTATVDDVIRLVDDDENRAVELINGTLVEKPVGFRESIIASNIIAILHNWSKPQHLGVVAGEHGMIRMLMGNVRRPDAAFFLRQDLPSGKVPTEPAPQLAPVLAIEVISKSNTAEEMQIKLREYFESGVRLVWMLDPDVETVQIYDAPERFRQLINKDILEGGELLPGFSVRVGELFEID